MEERQTQIKEGAGLEDARLNTEFIDLLQKYSMPVLVVVAILSGGYFAYNKYQISHAKALDDAFNQFEAAFTAANPVSLVRIAEDQSSKGAVPYLSRLAAADLYLEGFRTGVPFGAKADANGKLPDGTVPLTDEQRQDNLNKAADLYKAVVDSTKDSTDLVLHNINGLHGLAAVAECRSKFDEARAFYQQVIEKAKAADLPGLVKVAEKRIQTLDDLKDMPRLYADAELPASSKAAQPYTSGLQNIKVGTDPNGTQLIKMRQNEKGELVPDDGSAPPVDVNSQPAGPTPPPSSPPASTPPAAPGTPSPAPASPGTPAPAPAAPPPAAPPPTPDPSKPK